MKNVLHNHWLKAVYILINRDLFSLIFTVVTDPDDFLTVANACLEKDWFYDFAKPWLGEGLVTGSRKSKLIIFKTLDKILK